MEAIAKPPTTVVSLVETTDKESSKFRSPLLRQMLGNKLKTLSDTEASKATEGNLCTGENDQEDCKLASSVLQTMQDFSSDDTETSAEPKNEIVNFGSEEVTGSDIVCESRTLLEPSADRIIAVDVPLLQWPLSNGMRAVESDQAEEKKEKSDEYLSRDICSPMPMLKHGSGADGCDNDDDEKQRKIFDAVKTDESHEASSLLVPTDKKNETGACNGEEISAMTTSNPLIDFSMPSEKPAAGTSVFADMKNNLEMGAASSALL